MNKRTILLTVLAFAFASTACQPPAEQIASGELSDEDLAAIVLRLLAKAPTDRYTDAVSLLSDLRAARAAFEKS